MKSLIIPIGVMVVVISCTPPRSQPPQKTSQAKGGSDAQDKPLFLHLLAERAYTDPPVPAHRLLATRVYPSKDFSISVGDLEDPFAKPWEGAFTNPIWNTNGIPEARPLTELWNSGDATLAGRIEEQSGRFMAHLQGLDRTTLNYFHGEIELEKPFYEQGGYYHGGKVWGVWFVLSTNADCSPFLRALEEGTLQRRNVVDRNSPLVDRWVGGEKDHTNRSPRSASGTVPKTGADTSPDNSKSTEEHHR